MLKGTDLNAWPSQASICPVKNSIHLWIVRFEACRDESLLRQYMGLLSKEELIRYKGFLFAEQQHSFLISRILLRTVLSQYLGKMPQHINFVYGVNGKPGLAFSETPLHCLSFNLSHTKCMAILAVSTGVDIGIDIEFKDCAAPTQTVLRYFSTDEIKYVIESPAHLQACYFWELWTLKEAYLKCLGLGLSVPLDAFNFNLIKPNMIEIKTASTWKDDPGKWWFAQWEPSPQHIASLCIQREHLNGSPTICAYDIVPLSKVIDQSRCIQFLRQSF